jgi:hypothetical protein
VFAQLSASYVPDYFCAGTYGDSAAVYSFTTNQATLGRVKLLGAAAYSSRLFMLNELNHFYAACSFPTNSGGFGISVNGLGNTSYRSVQTGLAYGRKLSEQVDVGMQVNYHSLHVNGYGNAGTVSIEGGMIMQLTGPLRGGVHVFYPASKIETKEGVETFPAIYRMGFGYTVSKQALLQVNIEKEQGAKTAVLPSISYLIAEKVIAKAGLSTATSSYFFSAGFLLRYIQLNAVATYQPRLGITPGLMIVYQSKKN